MGGPFSPLTAARKLCQARDWGISNLELQKMLYLAQMIHLGEHHQRLVAGEFEAWDYGPVLPEVYREARAYGSGAVRFLAGSNIATDEERERTISEVVEQLSKMTAGQLVSITHWKDGAWAKNYRPGLKGIVIPDRDILEEYEKRVAR